MTKLLSLVLLVGCADGSLTSDTLVTRDETGAEVDVVVGVDRAELRSQARTAVLAWTDTAATLEAEGRTAMFARADDRGVWSPQDNAAAFAGYGPMLAAGEQALVDAGISVPWRSDPVLTTGLTCETWSTWTFGGCDRCQTAVDDLRPGYGDSWSNTDRSCNSGAVTSSCSQTWCRGGGAEEMMLVD